MPVPQNALAALESLAERVHGAKPLRLEAMRGGASPRQFYRVHWSDARTAIGMFHPGGEQPNEIAKVSRLAPRFAFLEVRALLETRGVRVPGLFDTDLDAGWFLVEDLGLTLAEHLALKPAEREALYAEAVASLLSARRLLAELPPNSVVAERAFDAELLSWEIEHFREWGLAARGIQLSPAEEVVFGSARDVLAHSIAAWPRGFVHRDYQSRNLMVCSAATPRLGWIDFQDALLGPGCYDLVALLGDSYQTFDRAFIERRLAEFAAGCAVDLDATRQEFFLIMAQRKLKDAGRFVYLDRRRGNPHFLQFFEPTIKKAQAALAEVRGDLKHQLQPLAELLQRHFGEAVSSS